MSMPAPRTITIVGGGTAGWMVAAALARFLERGWHVRLIESDAIGTVGVGEATIPQLHHFNAALGIDEDAFVRATGGTFKLGIAFEGWGAPGDRYIHAFGTIGRSLGTLPFYHYWLAARDQGEDAGSLDDYSIAAQAAWAGRFARPDPARPAAAGGHAYAFHFDAGLYAAFLRQRAETAGVERLEGRIVGVERNSASGSTGGDVTAVVLDDHRRITGDLFVDCSGFAGLLIERELAAGYESWDEWLPCDRAVAVPSTSDGPVLPYTRAIARPAGWQWRIPLQHRTGNGHVYASGAMSDDEAAAILIANLPGTPLADPRQLAFAAGRRRSVWKHNVVAIGLASGFLEPLESTSIHLVQTGIERLLRYLPGATGQTATAALANDEARVEMEGLRDFLILHYAINRRPEPFWQARAAMPLPASLRDRLATFSESGRLARGDGELFTEAAWQQLLIGQGVCPRTTHPLAANLAGADRTAFLDATRRYVAAQVGAMPSHADFITTHCAAGATP